MSDTTLEEAILQVLSEHGAIGRTQIVQMIQTPGRMTANASREDVVEIMERLRQSGYIIGAAINAAGDPLPEPEWILTAAGQAHRLRLALPGLRLVAVLPPGKAIGEAVAVPLVKILDWARMRPAHGDEPQTSTDDDHGSSG